MTLPQLAQLLASLKYDVSYSHSTKEVPTPFIVYHEKGTSNFGADNRVYQKVRNVEVELYTDKKDSKVEKELEDLFDAHSIFYDADEFFIESENLFQRIYYITTN